MEKACSKKGGSNTTAFFPLFFYLEGGQTLQTPMHCSPMGSAPQGLHAIQLLLHQPDGDKQGFAFVNIFVSKYHTNSKVKYFPTWLIVIWESLRWSSAEPSVHFLQFIFPWANLPAWLSVICAGNDLPNQLWMFSGFYLPKVNHAKRGPHSGNMFCGPFAFPRCSVAVVAFSLCVLGDWHRFSC